MKSLLADPERARTFLKNMLPAELCARLNFDTLRATNQSFVRRDLREFFSDALFQVNLSQEGDKYLLISILLEHKSYPDAAVAIQMLTYLAEGYRAQAEAKFSESAAISGSEKIRRPSLHPIIPFLFYHGREDWEFVPLHQLFDNAYQAFIPYIPTFETIYSNLRKLPENDLLNLQEAWLRAVLLTQKFSHDPSALIERFIPIFDAIRKSTERNFFSQFIIYYLRVSAIKRTQLQHLWNLLPSNENSENMEWFEEILQKGYRKGIKKGYKDGVQTGYEEGIEKGIKEGLLAGEQKGIEKGIEKGIAKGIEKGIAKGIEQGINLGFIQTSREVIRNGIRLGVSIRDLSILTSIEEADIQRMIEEEFNDSAN